MLLILKVSATLCVLGLEALLGMVIYDAHSGSWANVHWLALMFTLLMTTVILSGMWHYMILEVEQQRMARRSEKER